MITSPPALFPCQQKMVKSLEDLRARRKRHRLEHRRPVKNVSLDRDIGHRIRKLRSPKSSIGRRAKKPHRKYTGLPKIRYEEHQLDQDGDDTDASESIKDAKGEGIGLPP